MSFIVHGGRWKAIWPLWTKEGVALEFIRALSQQASLIAEASRSPLCWWGAKLFTLSTFPMQPLYSHCFFNYLFVPCVLRSHLKWASPSLLHSSVNFFSQSLQMVIMDIVFNESCFSFFFSHPFLVHFSHVSSSQAPLFLFLHVQTTTMFHDECGGIDWWNLSLVVDNSLRNRLFLFNQWWCIKHLCYKSHCGEFSFLGHNFDF